MKITFFGVGYVGLVQAAVLADKGNHVVCVDVDNEKIENLKKGIIPIYEPGLTPLVEQNFKEGRLTFTTSIEEGVEHGDYQFIAVGTPPDEDGSADLKYVLSVASSIAKHMQNEKIIINKSTVPVGTAEKVTVEVSRILEERGETINFHIVSNPEFLKEGSAVADCTKPDRIIVGTDSEDAADKMQELYAPFNRNRDHMIIMDVKSAELTKYVANCMLATKISFMNEMSNIAEQVGADIEAVRNGIGSDERIGYHFIYPGCGYGGSCFPKDVQALIRTTQSIGFNAEILQAVESVNYKQKETLIRKLNDHYSNNLKGKTFALWGLSFKPNTDDMREAPSRVLMEALWNAGATVQAFDPEAMQECQRIYGNRDNLKLMGTKESTLNSADALIIVTEWSQFRVPDFNQIKDLLAEPVIFDGRNLYDPKRLSNKGFTYYSIGRKF